MSFVKEIVSERGNTQIVYENYKFSKHRSSTNETVWRFIKRPKCNVYVYTIGESGRFVATTMKNQHNHEPEEKIARQVLSVACKRKAEEPIERPTKILHNELNGFPSYFSLETLTSNDLKCVKENMYNRRRKSLPTLPRSAKEVHRYLQEHSYKTSREENFVLENDFQNGIAIFICQTNLKFLYSMTVVTIEEDKGLDMSFPRADNGSDGGSASQGGSEASFGLRRGKCKWFNVAKGWGFITPDDGGQDVFVHQSVIQMSGFRSLGDDEEVEFECQVSGKGLEATKVTGPQKNDCRGSHRRPSPKKRFRKLRCYNCGEFANHIAAKCSMGPQPKRCHGCKSEGHLIADCPSKSEKITNMKASAKTNQNKNQNGAEINETKDVPETESTNVISE